MGKITVLNETTKKPITLMGERAGVCWGADIEDPEKNYKRGMGCLEAGHGRVMEYVNVEMVLDGYSARVIREWYTHLGGAPTRLQASTRYIDYENFTYVTPPKIAGNIQAKEIYDRMMSLISKSCKELETALDIPREDAALLLPLGMTTKIVDKRNLRNLIDMSHQRLCKRAYHEYRGLMNDIYNALSAYSEEWKTVLDKYFVPKCDFLAGGCPEKVPCGRNTKSKKEDN